MFLLLFVVVVGFFAIGASCGCLLVASFLPVDDFAASSPSPLSRSATTTTSTPSSFSLKALQQHKKKRRRRTRTRLKEEEENSLSLPFSLFLPVFSPRDKTHTSSSAPHARERMMSRPFREERALSSTSQSMSLFLGLGFRALCFRV